MIQKERIVSMCKLDILPQKWIFKEAMVIIDFLEYVKVSMQKSELIDSRISLLIVKL